MQRAKRSVIVAASTRKGRRCEHRSQTCFGTPSPRRRPRTRRGSHGGRCCAGPASERSGVAALGRLAPAARAASSPRIVVVGAGLAGLTCAYRLRQAGYAAQVYEASDRVGGRCWTLRGAFADGQIAEHGGELIDQGHNAIRNLAQELGLRLDNLLRAEANGTELLACFDGEPYTYAEITDDIKQAWKKIHEDVSAASYPTLFDSFTQRGYELDHLSIVDWIDESIPGGTGSRLGPAARCRLQHRVRRRDVASRARSTSSTCSATRGRASSASSASRTRSTTCAAATTRSRPGSRPRSRARSRPGRSSSPSSRTSGGGYDARRSTSAPGRTRGGGRRARPRAAVLDPPPLGRPVAGRLLAAKAARDPRARHGHELEAPRPVPVAPLEQRSARTGRPTPTRATRTRGR